uniref:Uncharacterized protein n=1 Tax=Pelusios castaneus TaxID=367368 RepID=A0A8C8VH52_9SAUR
MKGLLPTSYCSNLRCSRDGETEAHSGKVICSSPNAAPIRQRHLSKLLVKPIKISEWLILTPSMLKLSVYVAMLLNKLLQK